VLNVINFIHHKVEKEKYKYIHVSSTGCNNERQSFANLSYRAIDNVLTNLLPAVLQDFFQVLNVSNATTTVNKLLELSPDRIVHLSAANFLVPQILAHEDEKMQLLVVNDELAHHPVEK